MREIKFRAWNGGKMQYNFLPHPFTFNTFGCPIMQFTGLKDKNGKDIYEGDIIKMEHPYKNRTCICDMKYRNAAFVAAGFYMAQFDNPSDFTEGAEYIEVIGNIHENPELLTSK